MAEKSGSLPLQASTKPPVITPPVHSLPAPIRDALREAVDGGKIELPLLPEVAGQVLAACSDDSCDIKKIAGLIQRDPSMAANLLRVANSALYAPPVPIVSLPQAVARLGLLKIREAAMIISCQTKVFKGTSDAVRGLFRHAVAAGAFAQEVARMRRWNVEEAFLCGLLHDLGKPILLHSIDDLEKSLQLPLADDARAAAVDSAHAEVGASLVKHWKLPARLVETIRFHHDPLAAPTCGQTAMMTQLSDELAHLALGDSGTTAEELKTLPVLDALNIYPEELEYLLSMQERVVAVVKSVA